MKIFDTPFNDLFLLEYHIHRDTRGEFVKTIHDDVFQSHGLDYLFVENYFSVSHKNVIRGMHFQNSPHDHAKLVYAVTGRTLDVVLDIRKSSPTYGEFFSVELSAEKRNAIYIGKGFAHGFLSLEDNSLVEYHTTTAQNKASEDGIKWDSFGFEWNVKNPIISERDQSFKDFKKLIAV
ncbi:MAG: dTDP-4-dehydrorhamnose 3,5-epimerase [Mucilaginibacter sp.]|uniref:dTDP-4-dehydrorhamnose 3,5-epimerase n=1 Tax=Mucilaginibacter sp. TaxID=1882438 RepID=UPI0034E5DC0A